MSVVDEESNTYRSRDPCSPITLIHMHGTPIYTPWGNGVDSRAFPHGVHGGSRVAKIHPDEMIPRYVSTYRIYIR